MNSQFFNNFINNVFNAAKKNEQTGEIVGATTYAQALNVRDNTQGTDKDYDNFVYNGRLNTGVIADAERESVYIKEMSESWREMYEEDYKEAIPDEAERKAFIDKLIEYDVDPYMKMTESDGAGYITIDAYRTLKKASKQWTYEQEQLYKKLVAGEKLTPKEVKEFFPPYKLQYYGALHDTVISVVGMHKFALTPLVPGALGGAQLQKLHEEMLRSNRQYVLFGSGSKVSTVTLDGNFDDVFLNDKQKAIKTGDDFQTANNIIYVEYLKDVTSVNSTFKKKVTAGTQQRVMFVDNFFKDGEIVNPEENKELVEGYIQNSRNITNVLIAELLNEIGFVYKDGMYQASGNSVEKFVNTIKKGLGKKAVPKHLVDLVGVNVGGQATMDYSLHPIADDIEALATALIQKRIIRQKAKGEPLIQVPSTLYNGLWDTDFELITDEKEIEKLLGSNNLPFYRRGKKDPKTGKYGPSSMMKVAITMQADFENLYQRLDLNGKKIAESPDPLGLLNKLIQNDEWLDKDDNRFAISVTGPRIPTDGINLVEGAEVWHFFEPQMGNIVVVPTEIVAKTGGDFDVDKLNFEYAYIDGEGFSLSKPLSNAEFKAKLTEATEKIAQRAEDRKKGKKKAKGEEEEVIITPSAIINAQKKALHNQSIQLRLDILRLPDTFANLTKPNSTYLVEQYAKLVAAAQPYKKLDNRTIKGYKFDPKDKDKAVMSSTRTLEIGYNMHKFEVNLSSGQLTLGITAKQNKQHVIDNEIGAKMPDSYYETVWKDGKYVPTKRRYLVDLHFNHNTTTNKAGKEVISLAGLQTRKGTRITSINSHNLNGILDRAKKSFPGELNMVPETMPIINHLIEAGVDEEQALYFVNLPLIKKYVRLQREFADVYGKIRMVAPDNSSMNKFQAAEKTVGEYEASGAQENTFVNEIRLKATFERLMAVLDEINPTTELSVYFGQKVGYVQMTASQLKKGLQAGDVSPFVVRGISLYDERLAFPLQKQLYKPSSSIVSTANYYYAKRIAFDKVFGSQEGVFTTKLIKDSITKNDTISRLALAFLLHYIQIEHQIKGMQEAAALMSPDTSFVKTIQQVRNRQQRIADLKKFGKVDEDLMNDFEKKSILGSFRIDQLMMDTIEPLFPLRLDRDISEYIEDATNRFSNTIAARFGQGIEGKERFSSMFNNAVVTSLFQNTLSNFPNAKIIDEDLMLPEGYKGYKISINDKQTEAVKIENGVISINIELTKSDFADGMYLDNVNKPESYLGRGLFAFDAERDPFVRVIPKDKGGLLAGTSFRYFSNYVLFTVQRELLRTNNPIEKVREEYMFQDLMSQFNLDEPAAYEMYLVKRALRNSFNPGYVMGLSQFNYTDDVMRLLNQFPVLKQKFGIASQLAPESRTKTDKNIIVLNDSKATGDVADGYHNDLVQLGDITIRKGSDAENKYISDTFKFFSEMMYYQHGIGYSSFGFVKVYDSAGYITLMRTVGINYLQNPIDENQLEGITINLLDNSDIFKNYVVTSGFKRMVTDTAFEEYDEEDMLNELEQMNRKAKNPLVAEVIEAINAVETTNPFRAKDIEMFKDADAFIGFETTLNDPRLDAKSSTKVYRQAFGNLANKGKYTPDEVVALSGSGNFNRGGLDLTTAIQEDFRNKYKPEILRAIDSGVSTFLLGSYNDQRNLQDYYIQKYLESKGYKASTIVVGKYEYYKFTKEGAVASGDIESLKKAADALPPIEQNFADGTGGRTMEPQFKGKSTMELILSGDRTRTTRAKTDISRMIKDYGLTKIEDLVGMVIRMTDKKGNVAYTRITKVAPFTQEYQDATWQKEGWTKDVTDKNVGNYPYAIEFELVKEPVVNRPASSEADVILPIGTSGSGKSTFISSLPQENLVVISPDEMRIEFTGDIDNKSKDKEIYTEAAKRAISAIKQGKQVVFDTTNLTKDKRRTFIEAIRKEIPNANIQYKLMALDPELAKQRIRADIAAGKNRANVSDETIDRHAASYKQMLEDIKSEGMTEYVSSAAPVSNEQDFNFTNTQKIASLEQEIYELESQREEILSSTVEGITVNNLPKIKPESASKETGGRVGTSMDINIGLTSKDGVSVEKAAELIWMDNFADTESGITDYEIRNIIIDILSVGKKRYIEQITKQDVIEDLKSQIAVLKGQATAERLASMGTQLTLFDENTPEGLPPSKRSSKKCNN